MASTWFANEFNTLLRDQSGQQENNARQADTLQASCLAAAYTLYFPANSFDAYILFKLQAALLRILNFSRYVPLLRILNISRHVPLLRILDIGWKNPLLRIPNIS